MAAGSVSGQTRSRCSARRSHNAAAHRCHWCGSLMACVLVGHRARRGSKGVCSARSSNALPASHQRRVKEESMGVIIGMDPQALGHDRGDRPERATVGGRTVPARTRPGMPTCWLPVAGTRSGLGGRAATASANTSRIGWPTAARSSTCRRGCRRRSGSSRPATAARPTRRRPLGRSGCAVRTGRPRPAKGGGRRGPGGDGAAGPPARARSSPKRRLEAASARTFTPIVETGHRGASVTARCSGRHGRLRHGRADVPAPKAA